MKLIAPTLLALFLMTAFSYQELRANGRPKINTPFVNSKFSKSLLMKGNDANYLKRFYSIQSLPSQDLIFNFSGDEKYQIEGIKKKKGSKKMKWIALGAFWWAAFFDHYQDAIQDRGGEKEYLFGAGKDQWHLAKNLAHVGYIVSGVAVGMEFQQGRLGLKRLAKRTTGAVLIYWFVQVIVYDKATYNVWFDYNNEFREHGPTVFDLKGRDHRIKFSPAMRPFVDLIRVFGGLYLVTKY